MLDIIRNKRDNRHVVKTHNGYKAPDGRTVVLMVGGPASGKSSVRKDRYPNLPVIDSDAFKAGHPDYDEKNPGALHTWSSLKATEAFYSALEGSQDFVFDGTGSNAEKYVSFANKAKESGWTVKALYVRCDVATALKRNAERARTVSDDVVREKYQTIEASWEIISWYVDSMEIVNNGADRRTQ
jgi:predicted kinase